MKLYQIRSSTGGEVEKVEAESVEAAAQIHCNKALKSLETTAERLTGWKHGRGFFWAKWKGTDRYIGQVFYVEEAK